MNEFLKFYTCTKYVIVLEKRDHFAVKLFFQYKQIKVDTQLGFVHNSECLNGHFRIARSDSYALKTILKLTISIFG